MKAAFLLALLPALALGQGIPPRTSSSSGGISRVSSLGACGASNEGKVVWLSPSDELQVCDGTAWHQAWTEREGSLPNADAIVPARTLVLHAPAAAYALLVENNATLDLGQGPTDEIKSDGSSVLASSWKFNDVSTDVLANRTTNGSLSLSVARNTVLLASATAPASHCTSGTDAGGLKHYSSDGRLYYCNGTVALPLLRGLQPPAIAVDVASVPAASCATQTTTVTGALTTDVPTVTPGAALLSGLLIGNARVSAADTVAWDVCNVTAGALDQASTSYTFTLIR